jgi:hypothetical protein
VAATVISMAMCGCTGSKTKAVPVSGTVLLGDQPAANAVVIFHPVNGAADAPRPTARTDEKGHFTLTTTKTGDGAPPGEYRVTIAAYQAIEDNIVNLLPAKYAKPETSELKATIEKGTKEIPAFRLELR